MKGKGQEYKKEVNEDYHFLMRHNSYSTFNYFGCCSSQTPMQYFPSHKRKNTSSKISLKNHRKDIDQGHSKYENHVSLSNIHEKGSYLSNQKDNNDRFYHISNITQRSNNNNYQDKSIKKQHGGGKINLKNRAQNKEVHNYNNTNYIVEKYIVKPNQMNIFVNNNNQTDTNLQVPVVSPNYQERKHHYFQSKGLNNHEGKIIQHNSQFTDPPQPIILNKARRDQINTIPQGVSSKPSHFRTDFSFGNQQRNLIMNKLGGGLSGFKQVQSIRPSKQSNQINEQDEKMQLRLNSSNDEGLFNMIRDSSHNKGLFNMIRDASLVLNELQSQQSQGSEVIDNHQSMMIRFQQRNENNRPFFQQY